MYLGRSDPIPPTIQSEQGNTLSFVEAQAEADRQLLYCLYQVELSKISD